MTLSDVQESLAPGIEAALNKKLSYREATQVFQLALISSAMKIDNNIARHVAIRLGVTEAHISRVLSGQTLNLGRRPKNSQEPK